MSRAVRMGGNGILSKHGRVLSFVVVLVLSGALTLLLFDEARAVDIVLSPAPAETGSTWIHANVTIPEGQRLPLRAAHFVLEGPLAEGNGKLEVARGSCPAATSCVADAVVRQGDSSDAIAAIEWTATASPTFGRLYIETHGYGYSALAGHGYEVDPVRRLVATDFQEGGKPGYGWGYGSDEGDTLISLRVQLDPATLPAGTYWMTLLLDSGSAVIGTVSSSATPITLGPAEG